MRESATLVGERGRTRSRPRSSEAGLASVQNCGLSFLVDGCCLRACYTRQFSQNTNRNHEDQPRSKRRLCHTCFRTTGERPGMVRTTGELLLSASLFLCLLLSRRLFSRALTSSRGAAAAGTLAVLGRAATGTGGGWLPLARRPACGEAASGDGAS